MKKEIDGIRVPLVSRLTNVKRHVKDPIRYPKVQCGYEGLAQVMFATQVNGMMKELTRELQKLNDK